MKNCSLKIDIQKDERERERKEKKKRKLLTPHQNKTRIKGNTYIRLLEKTKKLDYSLY
jgi:hypothetical protein